MPLKDLNKRREYERNYRQTHKERYKQHKRNWNKANPDKRRIMDREQRKKFPWKKHYDHAKQRCTNPNHLRYSSYGGSGILFQLTLNEIKILYIRDNANKMIRPSLDRIDTYGNYTFENCRFLEFDENNKRPKRKRIK